MSLSDFKVVKRLGKYNSKNRSEGAQRKFMVHASSSLNFWDETKGLLIPSLVNIRLLTLLMK